MIGLLCSVTGPYHTMAAAVMMMTPGQFRILPLSDGDNLSGDGDNLRARQEASLMTTSVTM
jgi:hypothetical protein